MIDILSSQPGAVAVVVGGSLPPLSLRLDGWGGFDTFRSIITGLGVRQQGNYQFLHTLRDMVFIYTFGNRIGEMQVSGLSFAGVCDDDPASSYHGLEWVNDYYQVNCLSNRPSPVTLVLGRSSTFHGFLTDLSLASNDPERGLGQFMLRFAVVPEKATLD